MRQGQMREPEPRPRPCCRRDSAGAAHLGASPERRRSPNALRQEPRSARPQGLLLAGPERAGSLGVDGAARAPGRERALGRVAGGEAGIADLGELGGRRGGEPEDRPREALGLPESLDARGDLSGHLEERGARGEELQVEALCRIRLSRGRGVVERGRGVATALPGEARSRTSRLCSPLPLPRLVLHADR